METANVWENFIMKNRGKRNLVGTNLDDGAARVICCEVSRMEGSEERRTPGEAKYISWIKSTLKKICCCLVSDWIVKKQQ